MLLYTIKAHGTPGARMTLGQSGKIFTESHCAHDTNDNLFFVKTPPYISLTHWEDILYASLGHRQAPV